jgi:hypothetical protein
MGVKPWEVAVKKFAFAAALLCLTLSSCVAYVPEPYPRGYYAAPGYYVTPAPPVYYYGGSYGGYHGHWR